MNRILRPKMHQGVRTVICPRCRHLIGVFGTEFPANGSNTCCGSAYMIVHQMYRHEECRMAARRVSRRFFSGSVKNRIFFKRSLDFGRFPKTWSAPRAFE